MLTLKHKKETEKTLAHTEVYYNNELLGYFLPNDSIAASKDENWNFVPKSNKVSYFYSKTKKELIETIEKQIKKEHVILNQHFGMKLELNA